MRPEAVFLSCGSEKPLDDAVRGMLRHMGVRVRMLTPGDISPLSADGGAARGSRQRPLLAVNAASAAAAVVDDPVLPDRIRQYGGPVLIFGAATATGTDRLLREVTDGVVQGVGPRHTGPLMFGMAPDAPAYCEHLSGVAIGPTHASCEYPLVCEPGSDAVQTLVSANGEPLFVRVTVGETVVHVLATDAVLSLDESAEESSAALLSRFVPLMMLARGVFGPAVWHPSARFASLVIDDPLIQRSFGYLRYDRLLDSMRRDGYATSIAFIPVNRKRTSRRTAQMIAENPDRFSVSFHGCDHTSGEFGAAEEGRLRQRVVRARCHMHQLGLDFGLSSDGVMVFPQGVFSEAAMQVLASEGFEAVANTTPRAVDDDRGLRGYEHLASAITRYSGLPLFRRRYPRDSDDLVLDLFVGRPALIVAHPSDFKTNSGLIRDVVRRINEATPDVRWGGLGRISRELHCVRDTGLGRRHVLITSDRAVLTNSTTGPLRCLVVRLASPLPVESVRVAGEKVPFRRLRHGVAFVCELGVAGDVEVRIERSAGPVCDEPLRYSADEWVRVFVRRSLCEFRDRYLIRSDVLSRLGRHLTRR